MSTGSRNKCILCVIVLVVLACLSLCLKNAQGLIFFSPGEVINGLFEYVRLLFVQLIDPIHYADQRAQVLEACPTYESVAFRAGTVLTYLVCGILLAVSGMLYQNTFRNPIAAPSMLGVSNGISIAILVLVLQYGWEAQGMPGLYYTYSLIGGLCVLALVMLGGKWMSGKGRFNTVNMILMGTVVSQLLSVVLNYARTNLLSEEDWDVLYILQQGLNIQAGWTVITLLIGATICIVPIVMFRFKMNLISFSNEETRLLGVNPNAIKILALACGSIMILIAQINVGQVAMVSLVIPFLVRALFGAEFRKQLLGNILIGAIVLVLCGDLSSMILIDGTAVGLVPIVTIATLPIFVWILAVKQRSWE